MIAKIRPEVMPPTLSVIIVLRGRVEDVSNVYRDYRDSLLSLGQKVEFIYVLDGPHPEAWAELVKLVEQGEPIMVLDMPRVFGEAACLREGIKHARAEKVLILPPFLQVETSALPVLVAGLETADLVVASRNRSGDSAWNRMRGWTYQQVARLAQSSYDDPGCGVCAVRAHVFQEINLLDGHQRFLALLAEQAGFRVSQVTVAQAAPDRRARVHSVSEYVDGLMDVAAIAFVTRFMQKPFRFFGSIGLFLAAAGLITGLILVFQRFAFHEALQDRPMLIVVVLLVVLGIQIAAVGLIAEIVIFTRSATLNYRIREIVDQASSRKQGRPVIDGRSRVRTEPE
jgi:hypothetical protein